MDISIDAPVGKDVGNLPRSIPIKNLSADQIKIANLLAAIPTAEGGRQEVWTINPLVGPDGDCPPLILQAIFDFQSFWKAKGVFHYIDGVVDPLGNTLELMNELADLSSGGFTMPPPEGQLDPMACWAASLAWMTKANPNVTTKSQMVVLAAGGTGVLQDGSITANGLMTVNLSGVLLNRKRTNATELEGMIRSHKFPMFVGFSSGPMGGHVNVMHGFDEQKNTVFVMEPWFPDPMINPQFVLNTFEGQPVILNTTTGAPFVFTGAHVRRPITYYTSRPLNGRFVSGVFA